MKIPLSLLPVLWLGIVTNSPTLSSDLNLDTFRAHTNTTIKDEFTYDEEIAVDTVHCAAYCAANSSCLSVSYNKAGRVCKLSVYRVNGSDEKLIPGASWITLTRQGCSEGWIKIGEVCYLFFDSPRKFHEAQEFCEQYRAKPAEPQTNSTYQRLRNYLMEIGISRYWLGVIVKEDGDNFTYVWSSTGVAVEYTDWTSDGESRVSLNRNHRCVSFESDYRWSIEGCKTSKYIICEN